MEWSLVKIPRLRLQRIDMEIGLVHVAGLDHRGLELVSGPLPPPLASSPRPVWSGKGAPNPDTCLIDAKWKLGTQNETAHKALANGEEENLELSVWVCVGRSVDNRNWIELVLVGGIVATPILMLAERLIADRGMGARVIQFLAVAMLIPTILLLSLEKILEPATVGTLIGALTGYLLSGVGDYRPEKKKQSSEDEEVPQRQ